MSGSLVRRKGANMFSPLPSLLASAEQRTAVCRERSTRGGALKPRGFTPLLRTDRVSITLV
eukprot:scaffold73819_cov21-Tisochrysis_lutea.AAC.1